MPFINVRMLEGRTHDQKKELVKAITDAMVSICDAKPEGTMVVIQDIPRDHWARGGTLLSEQ
jgi:4-oxalocrotonate tautomerase